ncbi:DNA-binding CsgD family transcriptional regulator [Lewinella aquimaris]|uniref:DNA-binding CsgD family transcriptional regulator n=1 Tax=Neolewinella aquimaris TaxID=1835722 RepID=A0A840E2W0_9BACT|nr:triple tyrosine motif-containing protein [Neolewinella aquimaris]MBB4079551.1 DNA-binding CsgD family transcriptional regulator [Neolewinella aquimaris]
MPRLLFFCCLCLTFGSAAGQELLTPRIRSFSVAEYGGENQNWGITQSPDGILYVANSGGVLRFDGLHWSLHQLPGRPTVRTVQWANDRLYVGGYGEFGYFTDEEGVLGDYTSLSTRLPAAEQTEEVWNIEVLTSGDVALQSFSRLYWLRGDSLAVQLPGNIMFAHATGDSLLVPVTDRGVLVQPSRDTGNYLTESEPGGRIVAIAGTGNRLLFATTEEILTYGKGGYRAWSTEATDLLRDQQINRIVVLRDGSVAVGTIMGGVYLFTADGRIEQHLSYGNGLSNNTVLALFEDRSGNLWVGLDRGLDLIVRSEPLRFYRQGKQPVGAVYAAAEYGGNFYIGTNQGLFVRDDRLRDFKLVPGTAGQVWELRVTPYGLLCGHNDGTFLVKDGAATLISDRSGGWQTIPLPGDSSRLLQANYTGISVLDCGGAGAEHRVEGLLAPIRFIARTERNEILALHGSRGAYRVRLSDDWHTLTGVDTIRSPDLIRPLLTRFGDTLLVQTADSRYRYSAGTFIPVTQVRGVNVHPGEYCLPGRVGTQEWFVVDKDRVTAYRGSRKLADYPVRLRYNFPRIIALPDSTYLFCLEDGYASYRPEETEPADVGLLLRLTRSGNNVWQFTYALPALDRPIRYRYRLLGFSDRWSTWSELGEKEYTNLTEGDYRFQVQGDWFGTEREIAFTVPPPWYRTVWAYLAYITLFAGMIYLLFREHTNRLNRQARKLEAIRLRQLQRQRIEARNQQLEEENHRKSRELANTTLTLAKKNEMLLDLKEELAQSGKKDQARDAQKLLHLIDRNLNHEEDWAIFESHFNEVHEAFLKRLRQAHPQLTSGDLQLAAYLKMDLSSKEIAPLLHISVRGVENKRYRLRKKLGLDGNDNLNAYVRDFQ